MFGIQQRLHKKLNRYKRNKVLFVVDVPNWAYEEQAKAWKVLLERKGEFEIDILRLSEFPVGKYTSEFNMINRKLLNFIDEGSWPDSLEIALRSDFINYEYSDQKKKLKRVFDHREYDGIVFFYHKAIADKRLLATPFPLSKVAVCINNEKWVEDGAKYFSRIFYPDVKILVGCNKYIIDSFSRLHPNVMRASQCIDNFVFFEDKKLKVERSRKFTVGWSGQHGNPIKRVKLIRKACKAADVTLSIKRDLNRKDLNIWYNNIDAVVCASESEGGPMMLLEAGAVGVPVITTKVGLAREIIEHNKNGLIIDGRPGCVLADLKDKILSLKKNEGKRIELAKNLQDEILKNWTYKARSDEIRSILKKLCE